MAASRKQAVGAPSGVPELTPWGRSGDRPYKDCAGPSTRWGGMAVEKRKDGKLAKFL
jgi:hypothetical protein